jgi:trans-aconitate methyltransferase
MELRDAIEMLSGSEVEALGATTWADLGAGDGLFTVALADRLASGSVIHAIDHDASALRRVPPAYKGVRITTHQRDFLKQPWPVTGLDGILMANSLHYVRDQAAFIRVCASHMKSRRCLIVVEYDTTDASRWIPYPVNQARLRTLFADAGHAEVTVLHSRPSIYRRAPLYAAVIRRLDNQ